jgi:dihydrolipoamide dehydrogenase
MSTERNVDVAIIGAGTAGLSAISEVRKVTEHVVLINGGPTGTTCARVGCMPSKVLIQVASDFYRRHVLTSEGILGSEGLHIDWTKVLAHVRSLRDHFVRGVLKTMEELGDRYIQGYAYFREPTVLDTDGQRIRAKRIIIATGSSPTVPQTWQAPADRILTTDTLFEQEHLPSSMAVIGLGAIGVEMGQALARLGLHITGFDQSDRVAGLTDPQVNGYMRTVLERTFPLYTGAAVEVRDEGEILSVHCDKKTVYVDKLLTSLGRRPQVAQLGLENLGLPLDERGLPPYDPTTLQVGHLPVFIAGDANGDRPILHETADEGHIAGFNSVQEQPHCFQRRTRLNIVFSEPQIAVVGNSFAELQHQDVAIGTVRFETQGRATIMAERSGILRLYSDTQTSQLRGAELAAPRGEHLAHLLAWAIQQRLTVFEMLQMPFYHPVIEEGLRTALRDVARQVHEQRSGFELALCDSGAVGNMG